MSSLSSNIFNSVLGLTTIAIVGTVLGKALRYLINLIIARGLGAEALGVFALGLIVLKIGAQIAQAGLHKGAERYVSIYSSEDRWAKLDGVLVIAYIVPLIFGSVIAGVLILSSGFLSSFIESEFIDAIRLFAIAIPLYAVMTVGMFATRGFKQTKYSVYIYDISQSVTAVILILGVVVVFPSVDLVISAYIVSVIVGVITSIYFLRRLGGFSYMINANYDIRELMVFSLPILFVSIASYASSWADILLLSVFDTPAGVGIYQVAFETALLLTVVLTAANFIFPSIAADLYEKGSYQELESLYTVITKWITYISIFGVVFLLLFATDILRVFGEEFTQGALALKILLVGKATGAMVGPVGNLLMMSNNERLESLNSAAFAVLNVAGNWFLIQEFGIVGAAVATSLSFFVINILRLLEVRWILGFTPYNTKYWKGLVAVAIGALPMAAIHILTTGLVFVVVAGFIGTLSAILVLGVLGLDEQDRLLIESIK